MLSLIHIYIFDPAYYAVVRLESPEALANLVADAVDYYQPADSQDTEFQKPYRLSC